MSRKFERSLIKDPRGPDPLPIIVSRLPKGPPVPAVAINQQGVGAPAPRYIQPGPWKSTLTEKDVIGVWLGFGVGAPKQYFIIRKVGDKLRGMVCGTCDNTYTMAALDDFEIQGDVLKFNILHEDWGDGELPTFYKHVTAHVGWNEMRCTTAVDHQPPPPARPRPPGFVPGFSLDRARLRLTPQPATAGLSGRRKILRYLSNALFSRSSASRRRWECAALGQDLHIPERPREHRRPLCNVLLSRGGVGQTRVVKHQRVYQLRCGSRYRPRLQRAVVEIVRSAFPHRLRVGVGEFRLAYQNLVADRPHRCRLRRPCPT